MYKLIYDNYVGKLANGVYNTEKNCWIPFDHNNTDYQEYLKWLAEGNEPLPPDQPE